MPTDWASDQPRCSIIIPVFNRASLSRQCLDTVLAQPSRATYEIIVVDDGSQDSTPRLLDGYGGAIRVVRHVANAGFATACNDGASVATSDLLVFLNNDTIPQPGWLDALVDYADRHPAVSMVGARLLYPNDTIQHCGVTIAQDRYPRHLYAGFPSDHPAVNRSRQVQIVTAACALVRRSAFEQVGGFDTAFVNGYEDVDLCLRLNDLGHAIHYCHASTVIHFESVSAGRFDHLDHNTQLYQERWGQRVRPDDIQFYLDDGLLAFDYADSYPACLTAAPELAVTGRPRESGLATSDELLWARARQVDALLKDNIRLTVQLREAIANHEVATQPDRSLRGGKMGVAHDELRSITIGRVRQLAGHGGPLLSLLIPTKNGLSGLKNLLPAVFRQQCEARLEIIAVDSGSTDGTQTYLRDHGATVIQIEPRTFNHGLTRGLAARNAHGQYLIYVNQSTLPVDDMWLANLIAPFANDRDLAGVCSRVLPRPDADPLTRHNALLDASAGERAGTRQVQSAAAIESLSSGDLRQLINFHTVSCAIRPQALVTVPFREVTIGEDILWAKDALTAGYHIRHEPTSCVYHSHEYGYLDLLRRNVDDGLANRMIVGRELDEDTAVAEVAQLIRADWRYLSQDLDLTGNELQDAMIAAALRRSAQVAGQWLGINRDRLPPDLDDFLSLTASIRRDDGQAAPTNER